MERGMSKTQEQKIQTAKVFNWFAVLLGAGVIALAIWSVVRVARSGSPALFIVVLVLAVAAGGLSFAAQKMSRQSETRREDQSH